jgi:hypothetical protein
VRGVFRSRRLPFERIDQIGRDSIVRWHTDRSRRTTIGMFQFSRIPAITRYNDEVLTEIRSLVDAGQR